MTESAPPPELADLTGIVIAGKYRVERLLGHGGMGSVWAGRHVTLGQLVAIKFVHPKLADSSEARRRFDNEAKAAARLKSRHAVAVYDHGVTDAGQPYIVMEYLDGESLERALRRRGKLPLSEVVQIVVQSARALSAAHEAHIVHRDLKPDNVMLVQRGADADFVKVLDFGMARAGRDPDFATRDGAVLGTARYIAPEGAQGMSVGPEADVYAISTLLFHCLAGRTPFEGTSAVSILVQQVTAPPPDVRSFAPAASVPAALAELIHRNLAKDPSARSCNARTFGAELSACIHGARSDTRITARLLGGQAT